MELNKLEKQAEYYWKQGNYQAVINIYEQILEINPDKLQNYWYLGLAYFLRGEPEQAEDAWMAIILEDLEQSESLIADLLFFLDQQILQNMELNHWEISVKIYQKIKEIAPDYLKYNLEISQLINHWEIRARELRLRGDLHQAKQNYQFLLNWESNNADFWQALALINYELFDFEAALQAIEQGIIINSRNFIYYYQAGLILERLHRDQQAAKAYEQAISLNPQHIDAYNNLGNILFELKQLEAAENIYKQAIAQQPNHYGTYINWGNLLMAKAEIDQAITVYKKAVIFSKSSRVYFWVVNNIRSYNYIEAAINFAQEQAELFTDNIFVQLEAKRILPFVYQDTTEIDYYRQRVSAFIKDLLEIDLTNPTLLEEGFNLINRHTNYHIHYQAKNDLDIQRQYGLFIQKVMTSKYPQFSEPPVSPARDKIKVGYISPCLRNHVVGRLALGWLKNHNREKLEIVSYYLGDYPDQVTREFQQYSQSFYHFTNEDNLEKICQQIVKDQLNILVFLDLGMSGRMAQLAGLKLASVQCVTWMHPITAGIPTIDYFISSQLLEGEEAANHYTEKLIKLPNLSIYYQRRKLPSIQPDRRKFNLAPDAIVYLSSQFPSKYLPQYDYLFPAIAREVKNACFVFVHPSVHQGKAELINQQLWLRIKKAFADYNLNSEDYCQFLPTIKNSEDYWQLFYTSDVFLDTIGFTGFNSTLDALESGLPVVTCPGEFFRTRQSLGILARIEVLETVAHNEREYLEIAIKLGLDCQWWKQIVKKIQANIDLLYEDAEVMQALDDFYLSLV